MFLRVLPVLAVLLLCITVPGKMATASSGNVFVPTSSWLVGPASLVNRGGEGAGSGSMPCVMMSQYDNGYTFRFSAGGGRVLAMAVDFRQAVFTPGQDYRVGLEISPGFDQPVEGTAYDEGTLIFNLQKYSDIYEAVRQEGALTLDTGRKKLIFSLIGLGDGLSRVERCFGSAEPAGMSAPQTFRPAPPPRQTRDEALPFRDVITPLPEDIESSAPPDLALSQKPAGQRLAKEWGAVPVAAPSAGARDIIEIKSGGQEQKNMSVQRFRAIRGSNLRAALEGWAGGAGVRVLWMMDRQDIAVKNSVAVQDGFEAAVTALLAQYEDESEGRPIGRLYADPASGGRVLVIESAGGM